MFHRKYGRITCSAWIDLELQQSRTAAVLLGGIVSGALCAAVGILTGSPHRIILELSLSDLLPPLWLFNALRFFAVFTVGCAAGLMLGNRNACHAAEKYRGGMLFLLALAAELGWYAALLGGGLLFWSAVLALLASFFAVALLLCAARISSLCGWLFLFHSVWSLYPLVISLAVLLRT